MDSPFFLVSLLDLSYPVFQAIVYALLANDLWLPRSQERFLESLNEHFTVTSPMPKEENSNDEVRSFTTPHNRTRVVVYIHWTKRLISMAFRNTELDLTTEYAFLAWKENCFTASQLSGVLTLSDNPITREEFFAQFKQLSQ